MIVLVFASFFSAIWALLTCIALLSMPHEGKHVSDIDHAANHLRVEVLGFFISVDTKQYTYGVALIFIF